MLICYWSLVSLVWYAGAVSAVARYFIKTVPQVCILFPNFFVFLTNPISKLHTNKQSVTTTLGFDLVNLLVILFCRGLQQLAIWHWILRWRELQENISQTATLLNHHHLPKIQNWPRRFGTSALSLSIRIQEEVILESTQFQMNLYFDMVFYVWFLFHF